MPSYTTCVPYLSNAAVDIPIHYNRGNTNPNNTVYTTYKQQCSPWSLHVQLIKLHLEANSIINQSFCVDALTYKVDQLHYCTLVLYITPGVQSV